MIRRAGIQDAGTLAALAMQMWKGHDPEELAEEFGALLKKDDAACFLQLALRLQILRHGDHIDGTLVDLQRLDSLVDDLMAMVVETLRRQQVGHLFVGLLLNEQSTQDGSFEVELLRLFVAKGIRLWNLHYLTLGGLFLSPTILIQCWHDE